MAATPSKAGWRHVAAVIANIVRQREVRARWGAFVREIGAPAVDNAKPVVDFAGRIIQICDDARGRATLLASIIPALAGAALLAASLATFTNAASAAPFSGALAIKNAAPSNVEAVGGPAPGWRGGPVPVGRGGPVGPVAWRSRLARSWLLRSWLGIWPRRGRGRRRDHRRRAGRFPAGRLRAASCLRPAAGRIRTAARRIWTASGGIRTGAAMTVAFPPAGSRAP